MRCPLALCLAVRRELHDAVHSLVHGIDLEVVHGSPIQQPDCLREIRPPRRVVNHLAGAAVYGFPAQPEGLKPVLRLRHSPDTGPESGTEGSWNVFTHFLDCAPLLVCLKHSGVRSVLACQRPDLCGVPNIKRAFLRTERYDRRPLLPAL